MIHKTFRFNMGKFECIIISDGTILVPDPPPPTSPAPSGMPHGKVMDITCLFINTGEHRVLVDTGCGDGFQSTAGKLAQNLKAEGINYADIDTIIYTHGHTDHVGGSFDSRGRAIFPNARHIVLSREWEYWTTGTDKSKNWFMFASARKNLVPISQLFYLGEENAEVLPGFKLIKAFGHTPGNAMLEISSGAKQLLCIGDLVHTPLELARPEYYSFLDSEPEQAIRARVNILSQIASSGRVIFACHFPFPGLGCISHQDGIQCWQPIREPSEMNL